VFAIDLAVMQKVIGYTKTNKQTIIDALNRIKTKMTTITSNWGGPAATSYSGLVTAVTNVTNQFTTTFDDAITRMQGAYDAYVKTEGANYVNLQKPPPHNQWHRPPPPGTGPVTPPPT
jgi:uncharacterized protein YukE